jgi:hypothetical protein
MFSNPWSAAPRIPAMPSGLALIMWQPARGRLAEEIERGVRLAERGDDVDPGRDLA